MICAAILGAVIAPPQNTAYAFFSDTEIIDITFSTIDELPELVYAPYLKNLLGWIHVIKNKVSVLTAFAAGAIDLKINNSDNPQIVDFLQMEPGVWGEYEFTLSTIPDQEIYYTFKPEYQEGNEELFNTLSIEIYNGNERLLTAPFQNFSSWCGLFQLEDSHSFTVKIQKRDLSQFQNVFGDARFFITITATQVRNNPGFCPENSNQPPTLSFSQETGYVSDGIHPNKGTASSTMFALKAVYTDTDNNPPSYARGVVNGELRAMTRDEATTTPELLRDGNYANGEQYALVNVYPKGEHTYFFEVSDGNVATRLPVSGVLNFEAGYSNVAFLPGLEASRLYKQQFFENQLWEPNLNDDVRKLYLSSTTGESLDSNIYTKDVIGTAYGVSIYAGFLSRMNTMETDGIIDRFETLPYDWRIDVKDVVTRLIPLEVGGYRIATQITDLANTSPTGKVTLITHSNGGLVVKELVEDLKSRGQENLIDRIIMIAAPELGTPKAIIEMLHGAEFPLGFPNREVTRELAENMKSAYALLPSRTYFDRLRDPLIRPLVEFSTTTSATQSFRNIYGDSISDYNTLRRFLRGENGARMEPPASEVSEPNVLKENFLANAETRHEELDTWTPPLGIDVIEIIGWGLDTPRGVRYEAVKKSVCNADLSVCSKIDVIDPQPLETSEGDGTVVYPSAEALGGERYYVNIKNYNKSGLFNSTINRDHKNILEIEPLQTLIATLLKHEATSTLPSFISSTKPPETRDDKRLRIGIHSPVALHLYDSFGRHTGPISNPDPSSDLELSEEQIPNSYYWQIGEGQYAGIDGATTTTIELKGAALGTFTIDIENIIGGVTATTTVYEDIPVTASTTATIQAGENIAPIVKMDIDGDGTIDAEITPGGLTAQELTNILKGLVKTLHLPVEKENKLIKKIEKLEKELKKEHKNEWTEKRKTVHAFEEIIKTIKKYEKKGILTHDEAGELITIIEQIQETVVE